MTNEDKDKCVFPATEAPDDLISRREIGDWLAHRCDYAPPCGRCAYCRVAYAISVWTPATTGAGEGDGNEV